MIDMSTFVTDLGSLNDDELEKAQLAVNVEVSVRIQNTRLARRIESAVTDAQGVGFTDSEISTVIEEAKVNARKGKKDPDADVATPTPGGENFTPPKAEQATTDKKAK